MWAEYFKEREGFETIETGLGVASYRIEGSNCYIKDIFVLPEHRQTGEAFKIGKMVEEIAKEKGCKTLSGSCVPSLSFSTESMAGMIKFGFKLHSSTQDFIVLVKEI